MTVDRDGRSELHHAALANDVAAAKRLLAAGIEPNEADQQGLTALHFAAQHGSVETAELLLANGASVDAVDRFGNTALRTATFNSKGVSDDKPKRWRTER